MPFFYGCWLPPGHCRTCGKKFVRKGWRATDCKGHR